MKNLFPSRVIVCVITLLTLTFPVFAQTTNATDEYEETLKKMMKLSGASAATDDLYPKMLSVMKLNAPGKDDAYWNDFAKSAKKTSWYTNPLYIRPYSYIPPVIKHIKFD